MSRLGVVNNAADLSLQERLKAAAKKGLSKEERAEQRLSYIYGTMDINDNTVTKEKIRESLEFHIA